jgi:hypothetical protein
MYGLSLALPAVSGGMTHEGKPYLGYEALQHGWFWGGFVPELANVALLAGWIGYLARLHTLALVAGLASLGFSMSTFWVTDYTSVDLKVGFWLWSATMAVFSLAAIWEFFLEQRSAQKEAPPQG